VRPSDIDILAIGSVYGRKKEDISLDPRHCPEPGTLVLVSAGLAAGLARLNGSRRSRARRRAAAA
jgi:hypothetical protein